MQTGRSRFVAESPRVAAAGWLLQRVFGGGSGLESFLKTFTILSYAAFHLLEQFATLVQVACTSASLESVGCKASHRSRLSAASSTRFRRK